MMRIAKKLLIALLIVMNIGVSVMASHYLVPTPIESFFRYKSPQDETEVTVALKANSWGQISELRLEKNGTNLHVPQTLLEDLRNVHVDSFQLRFDADRSEYLFLYFEYENAICNEIQCSAVELVFDGVNFNKRDIQ